MKIYVNNTPRDFSAQRHLSELLDELQLAGKQGIAVALNNEVITKSAWQNQELKENDQITILTATQGG